MQLPPPSSISAASTSWGLLAPAASPFTDTATVAYITIKIQGCCVGAQVRTKLQVQPHHLRALNINVQSSTLPAAPVPSTRTTTNENSHRGRDAYFKAPYPKKHTYSITIPLRTSKVCIYVLVLRVHCGGCDRASIVYCPICVCGSHLHPSRS